LAEQDGNGRKKYACQCRAGGNYPPVTDRATRFSINPHNV
jgi:hypothetical protein